MFLRRVCLLCGTRQVLWNSVNDKYFRALPSSYLSRLASHLSDPENTGGKQHGTNFDQLGSWNNRMELEIDLEHSVRYGGLVPLIPVESIGVASLLGRRRDNEDRCLVKQLRPNMLLFALFDGHGGPLAADFTANHICEHFTAWFERGIDNLYSVIQHVFNDVHNAFAHYLYKNYVGNDQAMTSGTTATVCLLRDNVELVLGHVGDSRAVLSRQGVARLLTRDHKPDDPDEKERIKAAGGKIVANSFGMSRVNGRLDMTRSIGDVDLKPYGVIATPFIRSIKIKHGSDGFVVLTSDGVNNVIADQELVDVACRCRTPSEAADLLADQALLYGSDDNASVIVVPFGGWGKYSGTISHQHTFGRSIIGRQYV